MRLFHTVSMVLLLACTPTDARVVDADSDTCVRTEWEWWYSDPDEPEVTHNGAGWWAYNTQGDVVLEGFRPYDGGEPATARSTWTPWGGLERTEQRQGTSEDGALLRIDRYRYDGANLLVESWEEDPDGVRSTVLRYARDWDERTVTERIDWDDDGDDDRVVETTYDAYGRETRQVAQGGDRTSRTTWTYNERGHLIEESYSTEDGTSRTELDVAPDGRRLAQRYYRDGELRSRTTYVWDDGLLQEERRWSARGGSSRTLYEYDADGFLVGRTELDEDDARTSFTTHVVDAWGNPVLTERFTDAGVWTWREEQSWDCFVPQAYPEE